MAQVRGRSSTIQAPGCAGGASGVALTQPGNNGSRRSTSNDVKVTKLKITGDKATADVTPSADKDPTTYFVKEDGSWKIDADPASDAKGTVTSQGGSLGQRYRARRPARRRPARR